MSGEGAPRLEVTDCADMKVGVIAALWHQEVMEGLLDGALRGLSEAGITRPTVLRAPGSFDLPVLARALATGSYDAVVALGVVIRGTAHFEYVSSGVTAGLMQVSVDTGVPVGFGVLQCDSEAQALDRAGLPGSREDKGYECCDCGVGHRPRASRGCLRSSLACSRR